MKNCCGHEHHVGRRGFIKISALAGAAAAAGAAGCGGGAPPTDAVQAADNSTATAGRGAFGTFSAFKASPAGNKRNLLFLTDAPQRYEALFEKIRAIKEYDIDLSQVSVNVQTEAGTINPDQLKAADVVVMVMSQRVTSSGRVGESIPDVSSPVIVLPINFDFIMLEADMAAQLRARGVNALLANSEAHLIDLVKVAVAPRILEGKKALIFGRPFDSSSIPAGTPGEEYIYRRTGVTIKYRPIEELKERLESVSDATAQAEMERWKREATEVVETTDKAILDSCRLYFLLRSIAEEEQLDGISIDCLSFSFDNDPMLPYPCLPFTRLRDEGYAVPCEADVCGMLSSMVLQGISKRPSYFCNVSEAKEQAGTVVLRHCVSPLKMMGYDAPAMRYRLRDYHGTGRGATAEIQFPVGMDVTMGGFGKDLREFVLWPGRIISRVSDTDALSFPKPPPNASASILSMRKYCTNHLEIRVKDVDSFIHKIAGCHHTMVTGNYRKALHDAMLRMNVQVVGPSDFSAPA